MTEQDRLYEIAERASLLESSRHSRLFGYLLEDIGWLIAEVNRLRAEAEDR